MTNTKVAQAFARGESASTAHLRSSAGHHEDFGGWLTKLFSYDTLVAVKIPIIGYDKERRQFMYVALFDSIKYSMTTTRHTNLAKLHCRMEGVPVIDVSDPSSYRTTHDVAVLIDSLLERGLL
jgi:hypothetical protein